MPIDMPAIMPSASGVSCTRSLPNFSCNPAVARNTPPLIPMSSPSTTTVESCAISHACARLMASIIVTFAMDDAPPNGRQRRTRSGARALWQTREHIIEHRIGRLLGRVQIFLHGCVDERRAFRFQRLLTRVVPGMGGFQVGAQAQ